MYLLAVLQQDVCGSLKMGMAKIFCALPTQLYYNVVQPLHTKIPISVPGQCLASVHLAVPHKLMLVTILFCHAHPCHMYYALLNAMLRMYVQYKLHGYILCPCFRELLHGGPTYCLTFELAAYYREGEQNDVMATDDNVTYNGKFLRGLKNSCE